MIIAGFSGVGKTTFAKTHQNVINLHVMPYKYTNLNEVKGCKKIELKTNEYLSDVISFKGGMYDA